MLKIADLTDRTVHAKYAQREFAQTTAKVMLLPLLWSAGAARRAPSRTSVLRAELSFGSSTEHEAWLAAEAPLPAGFRVATGGFSFVPEEAPLPSIMNLTLIVLDEPSRLFAACFTKNALCGSPIKVGRRRLAESSTLQAVVINNKISNVCAAGDGVGASESVCAAVAEALALPDGGESVLPCSTGVIGWKLPVEQMVEAVPDIATRLQGESALPAARAIMTTDRYPKVRSASACGGRLVGFAKGAGMIEPDMATMLSYVLTDVAVPREALQPMLRRAAAASFNCMSVDADQSTSDTLLCLSSGAVAAPATDAELAAFEAALTELCTALAGDVARNGEGTEHVIRVQVRGAPSEDVARGVGKAVVNSPLFKSAVAGNDPNVGRLVAAVGSYLGRTAPELDLGGSSMAMGGKTIFRGGTFALSPSLEDELHDHLLAASLKPPGADGGAPPYPPHERCVEIEIDLAVGDAAVTVVGSDLTQEYVSINADYRS